VAAPTCSGIKVNIKLHEPVAGIEAPQALLAIANGSVTALVNETAGEPLFVAVTCKAVEVLPSIQPPKPAVAGLSVIAPEGTPVPFSATVNCPPGILTATVNIPVLLPISVGEKLTWIAQLAPAATFTFAQLSVSLKSPLAETELVAIATVPVFLRVTVCVLLALPYAWLAKLRDAGVTVAIVTSSVAVHRGAIHMPRP
jgi:hypothetical protein